MKILENTVVEIEQEQETILNLAKLVAWTDLFFSFAKIAKDEGEKEAARLFEGIGKIEVEHENMFKMLLERLEADAEFVSDDENEAWICEVCGHVHYGKKAPKKCPVCKHPEEFFSRLNSKK